MKISTAKRPRETESSTSDSSDASNSEEESGANSSGKSSNELSKLHAAISNDRFADVILTTKNNVEIKSHRCILGHFSEKLAKVIEDSSETPVRIAVKDFEAGTVKTALEFLYGKVDAIKGKEKNVLKFAEKYEIDDLKKACRPKIPPPKRAMSAFFYWMEDNRDKIKKPGMNVSEVCKAAGEQWRNLTNKSKWEKIAENDRIRYEGEVKLYRSPE